MASFSHWLLRKDAQLTQEARGTVDDIEPIYKAIDEKYISVTQLQALLNTARMARPSDLEDFISQRVERRRKGGRRQQAEGEFWEALLKQLRKLRKEMITPALEGWDLSEASTGDRYTSRVYEAFISHFVAHCQFRLHHKTDAP